jgi:glutathione S-transferase
MYLPLRARAEPLRMLLRHAKIPYEDEIVAFADWPALKPTVPNNQLPQLVTRPSVDSPSGQTPILISDTKDIAVHIAKLAGPPIFPCDENNLRADALDCWLIQHATSLGPFLAVGRDPWDADSNPLGRLGAVNPLLNFVAAEDALQIIPSYLKGARVWLKNVVEPRLERSTGPFFGGEAPHHGDFASFHIVDNICTLDGGESIKTVGGKVQRWHAAMHCLEGVASYLLDRPREGSKQVGKPGSLIWEHDRVADAVTEAVGRR